VVIVLVATGACTTTLPAPSPVDDRLAGWSSRSGKIVAATVTSVDPKGSTFGDPPQVTLEITDVFVGASVPPSVEVQWRPPADGRPVICFDEDPSKCQDDARRWATRPFQGPDVGAKFLLVIANANGEGVAAPQFVASTSRIRDSGAARSALLAHLARESQSLAAAEQRRREHQEQMSNWALSAPREVEGLHAEGAVVVLARLCARPRHRPAAPLPLPPPQTRTDDVIERFEVIRTSQGATPAKGCTLAVNLGSESARHAVMDWTMTHAVASGWGERGMVVLALVPSGAYEQQDPVWALAPDTPGILPATPHVQALLATRASKRAKERP
jgi:hypothetical protein